jgi:hypothetical protein
MGTQEEIKKYQDAHPGELTDPPTKEDPSGPKELTEPPDLGAWKRGGRPSPSVEELLKEFDPDEINKIKEILKPVVN